MKANPNQPVAEYDAVGALVPKEGETEEDTQAREAVINYATGISPNHPREVFPDYDPNAYGGDDPESQETVNKSFESPIPGKPKPEDEDGEEGEETEEYTDETDEEREAREKEEAESGGFPRVKHTETPRERRERERKEREQARQKR